MHAKLFVATVGKLIVFGVELGEFAKILTSSAADGAH